MEDKTKEPSLCLTKPKIYAAYLPQYHETEDNNRFWGQGYTDWVGTRNAKPQYEGHEQPKVPLNENYYDLSDANNIRWQAQVARKYGVDGFNIYHYWFKDGKQELEKPAELLLENRDIDIGYFFTWDNASWKRTWSNIDGNDWAPAFDKGAKEENPVLVEFEYGDQEQWEKHFVYLLDFFRDDRYLKIDGKPVFMFIGISEQDKLAEMARYWDRRAKEEDFSGMYYATKKKNFFSKKIFDSVFAYEPETSVWGKRRAIEKRLESKLGIKVPKDEPVRYRYTYQKAWDRVLKNAKKQPENRIFSGFVRYDDTPRRGSNAMIISGETPQLFGQYFSKLYNIASRHDNPLILLTAWNEWGEVAYLEPDSNSGFGYLEALKEIVEGEDPQPD